jgi:hypothetical protein
VHHCENRMNKKACHVANICRKKDGVKTIEISHVMGGSKKTIDRQPSPASLRRVNAHRKRQTASSTPNLHGRPIPAWNRSAAHNPRQNASSVESSKSEARSLSHGYVRRAGAFHVSNLALKILRTPIARGSVLSMHERRDPDNLQTARATDIRSPRLRGPFGQAIDEIVC